MDIKAGSYRVYQRRKKRALVQPSLLLDDSNWSLVHVSEGDPPSNHHFAFDQWLDLTCRARERLKTPYGKIRKTPHREVPYGQLDLGLQTNEKKAKGPTGLDLDHTTILPNPQDSFIFISFILHEDFY